MVVIKDLPVKGAPKSIKAGTKVKNIRLTHGDHNIDCKIDGFGAMALKSEFEERLNFIDRCKFEKACTFFLKLTLELSLKKNFAKNKLPKAI